MAVILIMPKHKPSLSKFGFHVEACYSDERLIFDTGRSSLHEMFVLKAETQNSTHPNLMNILLILTPSPYRYGRTMFAAKRALFLLGFLLCFVILAPCNGLHANLASDQLFFQSRKTALRMNNFSDGTTFSRPPNLAIITEPDACATDEHAEATFSAIAKAVETTHVDLVSVRLTKPEVDDFPKVYGRALELTKQLVRLADKSIPSSLSGIPAFRVVCSSDWVDLAIEANAHGVHVKEFHLPKIVGIRQLASRDDFLIGTSAHSVQSAVESYATYRPDYYFVGTCFLTASHPEKDSTDLEGPTLPGEVRRAILAEVRNAGARYPAIFAIGGIDESNCHIPVTHGADGVAVIRAVLQARNPAEVTATIHTTMSSAQKLVSADQSAKEPR
jgi:thiamine-phosphate diphosphorylase